MKALKVILSICLFIALIGYFGHFGESLHSKEWSPDGRYVVEVYKVPWFRLWATPGSSSDAPVVVYLKTKEGQVLERWSDMILQTSGPVEWSAEAVEVGPHGHWWMPVPK